MRQTGRQVASRKSSQWERRVDEVSTPILSTPEDSKILRQIRGAIRAAEAVRETQIELVLTPEVFAKAVEEFGLCGGHMKGMPSHVTDGCWFHTGAESMVRHVVHESIKALNWRWTVTEHLTERAAGWPTTRGMLRPRRSVAQPMFRKDFDAESLLQGLLMDGAEEMPVQNPNPPPALRAIQQEAWLLLGKLEQAVADTEEAQERLQEARLAAKGRGHTFASKHSPNDALRDIRWWHERLQAAQEKRASLEHLEATLREEAVVAAKAAILFGDWSSQSCAKLPGM